VILDTDFIINLLRNDIGAKNKLQQLIADSRPLIIAAPTLFELYGGIERSSKPEQEKKKVITVLQTMTIFSLDEQSSIKAGEIDGSLLNKGITIDPVDSMIAGIALRNGETILTRNLKHFSKIPTLKVETY